MPYPNKADFSSKYWYRAGKVIAKQEAGEENIVFIAGNGSPEDLANCLSETIADKEKFDQAKKDYQAETRRLMDLFAQDLFKDLGIENHPMRDKLFSKAWEDGHSNGLSEVYNCALNLVDLIELPKGSILITPTDVILENPGRSKMVQIYELAKQLQGMLK